MREFLVETLSEEGHKPDVDSKGNVVVSRKATNFSSSHLVLNTHLDTVPPHVPYERDGDIVRGRGACDAKGSLAAMIDAFCSASIDNGRLTLAVTPDEETAQIGGAYLGETLSADGYIVGEPTNLDVCPAARGDFGGHVTVFGESAHASDPTAGTNPLRVVGTVIEAIKQYDGACGPGEHEMLGRPTLAPTVIDAGGPLNQTPAECTVGFDRRTVPPETINEFVTSLESYLEARLPDEYRSEVSAAYPDSPDPEAFATDVNAELVKTLADVSSSEIRPFDAATDASYFADDGPVVVFGPGVLADADGPVAHAGREYVSRSDVETAAEMIRKTAERML